MKQRSPSGYPVRMRVSARSRMMTLSHSGRMSEQDEPRFSFSVRPLMALELRDWLLDYDVTVLWLS